MFEVCELDDASKWLRDRHVYSVRPTQSVFHQEQCRYVESCAPALKPDPVCLFHDCDEIAVAMYMLLLLVSQEMLST